jgi:hypothetical protein
MKLRLQVPLFGGLRGLLILDRRRVFYRGLFGEVSKLRRATSRSLAGIFTAKGKRNRVFLLLENRVYLL